MQNFQDTFETPKRSFINAPLTIHQKNTILFIGFDLLQRKSTILNGMN